MRSFYLRALAAVATVGALGAFSNAAHAQLAYAIAGGGFNLISFNLAAPQTILSNVTLTGNGIFGLEAIDFRPATGVLYGYSDNADTLFTVNTTTGALTAVANSTGTAGVTNAFGTGLDFNPAIDRVRVVNDADENRVYNPNSNASAGAFTGLFYAAGDSRAGVDPNITENAYNNNLNILRTAPALPAPFTQVDTQFAIDYVQGTLVSLANNTGVLTTRGSLGFSSATVISQSVGFDIFTELSGANFGYALLDTSGTLTNESLGTAQQLYSINVTPGSPNLGQATLIGSLGNNTQVTSLAIAPIVVVPEAGTLPLLVGGAITAGLGIITRRRLKK